MAAAPPSKPDPPALPSDGLPSPRPGVAISWDFQDVNSFLKEHKCNISTECANAQTALCRYAECLELESEAVLINTTLLPILDGLLLEMYEMLRPKPVHYEQRYIMVDVFNKLAKEIFGNMNGFPVVEAFGSFTMDLFTAKSDLDLSVNFNTDVNGQFARSDKIFAIRKLAKVLFIQQRNGRCYGVSPIVTARVPVLKVTDKRTGIECDISVENKDGMSRSMIFKLISSIDKRFQILCYLMKFWAKAHDVNCPKDQTMSSMAIISLVAFHLQTRRPPILPAFSMLLKDGSDYAGIRRNVLLFEGFGSKNKESIAELFVSLLNKLLSVESLWQQGLCASNFDGLWISKSWKKGIGNLSVEDFLDRSQNFARTVGKMQMEKICEYLRVTVLNLADFFRSNIDAPKLMTLVFGTLNPDEPIRCLSSRNAQRKKCLTHDLNNCQKRQKRGKQKQTVHTGHANNTIAMVLPHPSQNQQKIVVNHTAEPGHATNTSAVALLPPSQNQQKIVVNHSAESGHAANTSGVVLPPLSLKKKTKIVKRVVKRLVKRLVKRCADPDPGANTTVAELPTPGQKQKNGAMVHTAETVPASSTMVDALPSSSQKQNVAVKDTANTGPAANTTDVLTTGSQMQQKGVAKRSVKRLVRRTADPGANTTVSELPPPSEKRQNGAMEHTAETVSASCTIVDALPSSSQKQKIAVKDTANTGPAANATDVLTTGSQMQQKRVVKRLVKRTADPDPGANITVAELPLPSHNQQNVAMKHTADTIPAATATADALPSPSQKQKIAVKDTANTGAAANTTDALTTSSQMQRKRVMKTAVKRTAVPDPGANTTVAEVSPPSQKQQDGAMKHAADTIPAASTYADALPSPSQKKQKIVMKHTTNTGRATDTTDVITTVSQIQQKRVVKHTANPGPSANTNVAALPSLGQKQQKIVKHIAHPGHAANTSATVLPPPIVSVPPHMHRPGLANAHTQFPHIPQHLITPSRFSYGPPLPHWHSVPHSRWALPGEPQGDLMHFNPAIQHFNPAIQRELQAQHMFFHPQVRQPAIDMFHPYGWNGAQQIQYNEDRVMQRMPYGTNPNHWR